MPKAIKPMSALAVGRLVKPGQHAVGGVPGLELLVDSPESRRWILRIRVNGKRRSIGLGGFPAVTLEAARAKAREIRAQTDMNVDPLLALARTREANQTEAQKRMKFVDVAKLVWEEESKKFRNEKHKKQWLSEVERLTFKPWANMYVDEITRVHVWDVLRGGWLETSETHRRVRERLEKIFGHAIFLEWRTAANPAVWKGNLSKMLAKRSEQKQPGHFPSEPFEDCPAFVRRLQAIDCKKSRVTARALEFLILSGGRSNPVRMAEWHEFDFAAKLWRIPEKKMKGTNPKPHTVPLTPRMLEILAEMDPTTEVVFPPRPFKNPKADKPGKKRFLSDSTLSGMCRDMKIVGTPHGFRTSFTEWSMEMGYSKELSERALSHTEKDKVRAAYARSDMLRRRTEMMLAWDAFLNAAPKPAPPTEASVVQ